MSGLGGVGPRENMFADASHDMNIEFLYILDEIMQFLIVSIYLLR